MDNEFMTVSVRLSRAEYDDLQAIAQKDFTSKSSVIRRLLNRERMEVLDNGKKDG